MGKILFLFLIFSQVFLYKCWIDYNIDLVSSYIYDNYGHSFSYDNEEFDFFVIRGEIEEFKNIYFNINSTNQIDPYYYFSNYTLNEKEISQVIDFFSYPSISIDRKGYNYYYTFTAKNRGDYAYYCYLAIHSTDKGIINFHVNISYSSIAPWILTIIFFGVILVCSVVSMIISAALGRSPWAGLACFCIFWIICTHCK